MSECPGLMLEDFVSWKHSVSEDWIGFKDLIHVYEPYRESIENWLLDFDDEGHSWRGYAANSPVDNIPELHKAIEELERKSCYIPTTPKGTSSND